MHGLEHGRVIFWVKPSLPEEQRADIRALVDDDSYQMFLVPRSNMPYAVAATAWNADPTPNGTGRMLLCDEVNDKTFDALAAFRDEHRSQGPEPDPVGREFPLQAVQLHDLLRERNRRLRPCSDHREAARLSSGASVRSGPRPAPPSRRAPPTSRSARPTGRRAQDRPRRSAFNLVGLRWRGRAAPRRGDPRAALRRRMERLASTSACTAAAARTRPGWAARGRSSTGSTGACRGCALHFVARGSAGACARGRARRPPRRSRT